MTYFYCDFRDRKKQEVSGLLASLVAQLSAKSDACYRILSALYSEYDAGSRRPGDHALMGCLGKMLQVEGQPTNLYHHRCYRRMSQWFGFGTTTGTGP